MTGESWMRGAVKAVFILCYIAFMAASIRHVATFFNDFEPNNDNTFGSYALAGAFDITALVTTIGVMFFRKSMPRWVFCVIWAFILVIAGYSFFVNWEYANHYQDMTLLMQPTGATSPVYDAQGVLHYVPVMQVNTSLLWVNPFLASGFTIFSLIYSVVAEFFGAKQPTAEELLARKAYLEETSTTLEAIRKLEAKGKKPGIIHRAKSAALELKDAVKEVTKSEETLSESTRKPERTTDPLHAEFELKPQGNPSELSEEFDAKAQRNVELSEEESMVASYYEKTLSWLSDGHSTVSLKVVAETMNLSMKLLNNRVAHRKIRRTKGDGIVYKNSVVSWAIQELIPKESQQQLRLKLLRNDEDCSEERDGIAVPNLPDKLQIALNIISQNPRISDEELAPFLSLKRPASARFWRVKAMEILQINAPVVEDDPAV